MTKNNLTDDEKIYLERYAEKFFLTSKKDFIKMVQENFAPQEADYLSRAFLIPYLPICLDIQRYDYSKPKIDEIKFVASLAQKYGVNKEDIIKRIRDVRYLNNLLGIELSAMVELKTYNKLVRDYIPEIIKKNGEEVIVRILNDEEYWECLCAKLREELEEVKKAQTREEVKEELADLYEVFSALVTFKNFFMEDIIEAADLKLAQKGGFQKRIFLEKTLTKK